MAEQKKGKKPTGPIENLKVAQGEQKEGADVTGHMHPAVSPGMFYLCWNCGRANYVAPGYTAFYCWNCGVLNL